MIPTHAQREIWFESNDGVRLFAHEAGADGPAILFVHGGLADHRAALFRVGALATSHRLVLPDLRGSGRSIHAGERPRAHGIEAPRPALRAPPPERVSRRPHRPRPRRAHRGVRSRRGPGVGSEGALLGGDMTDTPHVLHFRVSHYNEKVRWALDFKEWPHTREAYVPGFHVVPMRLRTGQTQVPVMILGDETFIGSNHILAEIERRRPEPPLYPSDPAARERALAIAKYFDDEVAPDVRRLFWGAYFDDRDALERMATDGASSVVRAVWKKTFRIVRPLFVRKLGANPEQVAAARARSTDTSTASRPRSASVDISSAIASVSLISPPPR